MIKNWPKDERPREKLLKFGEHTLTDTELLAILLRTGVKGESAVDMARKILVAFKTFRNMSHTDISRWKAFKGLGKAKFCQIKAAIEIGRRFREQEIIEKKTKITCARDVIKLLMPRMRDLKKEIFKIILLDGHNGLISIFEMEEGTITQVNPIVRELILKTLQNFAASIICVHNHPSGNPKPSRDDKDFTAQIATACRIMQIEFLDHIVIGDGQYFSFAEEGLIK